MKRQFVSYPKSGRSWLRYALNQLGVDKFIQFHHDSFEFNDGNRPLPNFDFSTRLNIYRRIDRVVYLYREPRDIMVSLYFQIKGRFQDFFNYEGSISDFIRDDYFGAKNLKLFQDQWNQICHMGFAHQISYEQCHDNFSNVLRDVLNYYEFSLPDNQIKNASEAACYEAMKSVESSGSFNQPWLRLRNGYPKVREGKMNNYKHYFTKNDLDYLLSVFDQEANNKIG